MNKIKYSYNVQSKLKPYSQDTNSYSQDTNSYSQDTNSKTEMALTYLILV